MNGSIVGTAPSNTTQVFTGLRPGQETSEVERESRFDLPASKRVHSVSKTDRVEISEASKAMAVMKAQGDVEGELQLSPEKLREMASA